MKAVIKNNSILRRNSIAKNLSKNLFISNKKEGLKTTL